MSIMTREFSAQTFEFRFEVASPIVLNQHKGSALRGALFNNLRKVGCSRQELSSCKPCPLVQLCPVSFLLATVDEEGRRGGDVPRPFTINPPLTDQNLFQAGDSFTFGLTLFAHSVKFLPYLLVALQQLERDGLGAKSEQGQWRRGTLRLREIVSLNPLSDEQETLFKVGNRSVVAPENPSTHSQVLELTTNAEPNPLRKLHFTFHTPTRLIQEGKPLAHPDFRVLVQRLVERVSSLSEEYGLAEFDLDFDTLMEEAEQVVLSEDRTCWEQLRGYSNRQQQDLSLSGFVGEATFVGRVASLLPLLIWGQITHVGKDATKGNGWYSLKFAEL